MRNLYVCLLFLGVVLILSSGCMMEPKGPQETISIVAPPGTTYACYVDGESVGNVDEKGIEVKVEPGTHTISWTRDGETIEVTAWLPMSDDLLEIMWKLPQTATVFVYNIRREGFYQYGTAGEAIRDSQPIGSIRGGETYEFSLDVPSLCAKIKSSVNFTAMVPDTFVAEVRINIFEECAQEDSKGEEEVVVEKMNYKVKPFALDPLISRLTDALTLFFKSSIGK